MQLDPGLILEELMNIVALVQEISGEAPVEVSPQSIPLMCLPGFDSLRSVETVTFLAERLGTEIKPKKGVNLNIFVSDDGRIALTLLQASERLFAILSS